MIEILLGKNLPIEIVNMILSFRERHPVAKIMLPFINAYKPFVDGWRFAWVDVDYDYDFRHFLSISTNFNFIGSVKCEEVQKHFKKKLEKFKKKHPILYPPDQTINTNDIE